MASPICEREIESTMSYFSGQRLTGTANGGPSGRQGVPAVRVGWRMRLGMARRVLMDPPYTVPGLHTSPVPGPRETAWALAPQPPVTGIETNEQSQAELIKELDGLWDEVPDAPRSDWRYRSASMFVPGDATVYFALLRYWKPSLLVEVGSGLASVLALDCSDRYLPDLRRTFIDPHSPTAAFRATERRGQGEDQYPHRAGPRDSPRDLRRPPGRRHLVRRHRPFHKSRLRGELVGFQRVPASCCGCAHPHS